MTPYFFVSELQKSKIMNCNVINLTSMPNDYLKKIAISIGVGAASGLLIFYLITFSIFHIATSGYYLENLSQSRPSNLIKYTGKLKGIIDPYRECNFEEYDYRFIQNKCYEQRLKEENYPWILKWKKTNQTVEQRLGMVF